MPPQPDGNAAPSRVADREDLLSMCGIAGIFDAERRPPAELANSMAAALAHRGPDGAGSHSTQRVALAMRRLAIMDPAHGDQPLFNESRAVAVVFNGEIYNQDELRTWLESRGHRLPSRSDGEVIPHLYEELGPAFVERLNGIFAIALWDEERGCLHLMRDRFGVKPLYWTQQGSRLSFASELKALLVDPDVGRELDYQALNQFLTFRFVPSPHTLIGGVYKLPPATRLTCDRFGVQEAEYWTARPETLRRDRGDLIEEYAGAFERAVVRQTMSDRPIGVMLSGGLDSGAITAVLARHSSTVRTFTVGFADGGAETNEIPLARETARLFGAEHSSLVISASDYRDALPLALAKLDEPVGATSALAVRFVCALMGRDVPVALCGQGADEPQGGYWRHLGAKLAQRARMAPGARQAAKALSARGSVRLRRGMAALGSEDDLGLLMSAYQLFDPAGKRRLCNEETLSRFREYAAPEQAVERFRSRVSQLTPLGQMLYVDTRLWLPDELLLIADKLSMAESVELRVPFLDNELMELAESIDPAQKVRGLTRKSLHKQAMRRWLPRAITHRRERGWSAPLGTWLRSELRPLLEDVVLGEGRLCRTLFRTEALESLIEAHNSEAADCTRELFCLLSLGLWHEQTLAGSTWNGPSEPASTG